MRWMLVLGLGIGGGFVTPGPAAAADDPAATSPTVSFGSPFKALGGRFWYGMDMGVDGAGHVHLVASGFHAGKAGLWYATDRTGVWTFKRILTWSPGSVWIHPAIAIDANRRVHIAVEKAGCVECTIAPAKGIFYLSDVGRARGTFPAAPARMTPVGTAQPSLRVDSGRRFLVYARNPDLEPGTVRMRTWIGASVATSTIAGMGTTPFLRIGQDGKARVAFKAPDGLRYARASTLTGGWIVEDPGLTGSYGVEPALSMDETGRPHLSWIEDNGAAGVQVFYARRIGGTWTSAKLVGQGVHQALSVDKPGTPWVVTGGDEVKGVVYASGWFQAIPIDDDRAFGVAVKVLDSGDVVAAWVGGDPLGLWVSRT